MCKSIEALVGGDQDRLLRAALRLAAKQRACELEKERRQALAHIRRYERKYGVERKGMSKLDTAQAHEDYNDWFFWTSVLERAEKASKAIKKLGTIQRKNPGRITPILSSGLLPLIMSSARE